MKSKMLLALAGLLTVSMLLISPTSAQGVTYRANGTLDGYNPDIVPLTLARIVVGSWRIEIRDNKVDFKACYLELNVGEEIPGTKDKFGVILTDGTIVSIVGSNCEVKGTLVFYKIGFHPETGEFGFYILDFKETKITICPSGIEIDLSPEPPSWNINGTTLSIHY